MHKKSADYIRRGYELEVFDRAVKELQKRSIEIVVHVILGLPGETLEDMLKTVQYVVDCKIKGIKFQMLHILKNTDLEKEYLAGRVRVFSLEEYVQVLKHV